MANTTLGFNALGGNSARATLKLNNSMNAAKATIHKAQSTNVDIVGNALENLATKANDAYDRYAAAMVQQAAMANAASARAQQAQFEYNNQMLTKQQEYNASSAATANTVTKELMQNAMTYNAEEAQKNREWQERMSNTSYQRAIEDMRKAGINPILAAQNGGASVGSGATASVGSGNSAQSTSGLGSVGSYTGQMAHLNDTFAMLGSLIGTVGELFTSAKSYGITQEVSDVINDATEMYTKNEDPTNTNSEAHYVGIWKLGYLFDAIRRKIYSKSN